MELVPSFPVEFVAMVAVWVTEMYVRIVVAEEAIGAPNGSVVGVPVGPHQNVSAAQSFGVNHEDSFKDGNDDITQAAHLACERNGARFGIEIQRVDPEETGRVEVLHPIAVDLLVSAESSRPVRTGTQAYPFGLAA